MRLNKVDICGVDTSKLKTLTEERKKELLRLSKAGDRAAREELILGNLRLVLSIIQRFNPKGDSVNDLFQVGCIGLIKSIDNFNLEYDVKFSTYAVAMIIGEIRRYQRDNNSVRISRSIRDLAYRALQVKEEVSRTEGREPTIKEIAQRLSETERAVGEAMEAIIEPVSLYESVYNDGEDSVYVIDKLEDGRDAAEEWVESISLRDAMRRLSEREMGIITRRFYKGKTQMEIAAEIGISQAQVSRLEKGAIDKLRKYMS
jgi:RNA polymerase sporulation-specific sigma factor